MTNFGELAGKAMRDAWDRKFDDATALLVEWPNIRPMPLKPRGYPRRQRILELRRTQYRQWRMGWGKPAKKS